jgi:hypothetical protein
VNHKDRKIVSFEVVPVAMDKANSHALIVVLADDGTLWKSDASVAGGWMPLHPLPQIGQANDPFWRLMNGLSPFENKLL